MNQNNIDPKFNADGYPTEDTLDKIAGWQLKDGKEWFAFVQKALHPTYASWRIDNSHKEDKKIITITTGGWSGNEEVITAMEDNYCLWNVYWLSSERGGKHKFIVPSDKVPDNQFIYQKSDRRFDYTEFVDRDNRKCSLSKSSIAAEDAIWLGTDNNRMHLTKDLVEKLLPLLQKFIETGDINDK